MLCMRGVWGLRVAYVWSMYICVCGVCSVCVCVVCVAFSVCCVGGRSWRRSGWVGWIVGRSEERVFGRSRFVDRNWLWGFFFVV